MCVCVYARARADVRARDGGGVCVCVCLFVCFNVNASAVSSFFFYKGRQCQYILTDLPFTPPPLSRHAKVMLQNLFLFVEGDGVRGIHGTFQRRQAAN